MNQSPRRNAFCKALATLIEFAEESLDDLHAVYTSAFTILSYLAFTSCDDQEEVRELIQASVSKGFEEAQIDRDAQQIAEELDNDIDPQL